MRRKVLVTGAAGFLGGHLVRALCEQGHVVTSTWHAQKPVASCGLVRSVFLDVTCFKDVSSLIRRLRPDVVFHLAARTVPRLSWQDRAGTFKINTQGTLNFLEALRQHVPQARFLLVSSIKVYGRTLHNGHRAAEKDLLWPESPYASSKALAELAVLDYARRFHLNAVIARLTNSLGRGQSTALVFPDWARQIVRAEKGLKPPVLEVGNLGVWRDFLHVRDTVDGLLVLMKKGKRGEIYNVSSGSAKSLKAYVKFFASRSARPLRIQTRRERLRFEDPPRVCIDASKLKRLGWRCRTPVKRALEEILDEWREKASL